MALTDKNKLFADHYLVELNATKAAVLSGYSEKTARVQGSRLMTNVDIRAYIDEKQKVISQKLELNAEWVLQRLKDISDRCMVVEPVMTFNYVTKELEETGEYKFDSNGANKATELIGKHLKLFTDVVDHTGQVVIIKGEDQLED